MIKEVACFWYRTTATTRLFRVIEKSNSISFSLVNRRAPSRRATTETLCALSGENTRRRRLVVAVCGNSGPDSTLRPYGFTKIFISKLVCKEMIVLENLKEKVVSKYIMFVALDILWTGSFDDKTTNFIKAVTFRLVEIMFWILFEVSTQFVEYVKTSSNWCEMHKA